MIRDNIIGDIFSVKIWAKYFIGDITGQKIKFAIKDFFSKCDQIRRKLRIWSHLLKKSLMENFVFCAVYIFCRNTGKLLFKKNSRTCLVATDIRYLDRKY